MRARQICTGERWEQIQADVLARRTDPWSAADEMLRGVGA
jgi:LAO/AO transport system kinase